MTAAVAGAGSDPAPGPPPTPVAERPWWLIILVVGGGLYLAAQRNDPGTAGTLRVLVRGAAVTVRVTAASFTLAMVVGGAMGLARVSRRRWLRELATLYVELVRGLPLLVLILWLGYGLVPWTVSGLTALGRHWQATDWPWAELAGRLALACRRPSDCVSMELRGIVGLAIGYGAYIAEVVRAGIQSIPSGQWEAAASLGLTRRQSLATVILPQAMRLIVPPLGNDLVALLKDSALISVLAVPEIVQEARQEIARTFRSFQVWNLVALVYLVLTLVLSLGLRRLEGQWPRGTASGGRS